MQMCIVLIPKITESTKTRQNAVFISSTRQLVDEIFLYQK